MLPDLPRLGIDSLLVLITFLLLLTQGYSLRWGIHLMQVLPDHQAGGRLLRILMVSSVATLLGQALFFISAMMLYFDPAGSVEDRTTIFFGVEVIFACAVIWSMYAARDLLSQENEHVIVDEDLPPV